MSSCKHRSFTRQASPHLIETLKAEQLFLESLRPDIVRSRRRADVFPAVRDERIDFYHRGGRLFTYSGGVFTTHRKYASLFEPGKEYVKESDLPLRPISSFVDDYSGMKQLCGLYSGLEARGIADLCSRFSYAAANDVDDIVVLDIEASFDASARDDEGSQDRIDFVLFSRSKACLMFVEGKTLDNPAIVAATGTVPSVVAQLARYRAQVSKQRLEILLAYTNYVRVVNELFGTKLPDPIEVIDDVPLLVFGFDAAQRDRRLRGTIEPALANNNVKCLAIGDCKSAKPSTLVKWFDEVA